MHPSKAHQSTTKQPDSGLVLGFNPVKRDSTGKAIKETAATNTPSKVISSPPTKLDSSSKFDFRFSTDDSKLSNEAKKLMDSVREDVARIKAQMVLDKGEQQRKDEAAVEGRKIAKPKGKAGRFSDVHMSEFKKMDSIAGHASAFRAQPGRFQPVEKSLKRKSSKACLDEPEQKPSPSPSKLPLGGPKRVKRFNGQDNSVIRPPAEIATPKKTVSQSSRPPIRNNSLITPTKSSVARFASAKATKTSMIPSLNRSPASRLAAPRTPKTDFNPKLKKSLPSLGNLKSILKRRQPLFSNDPSKVAAGTHLAAPSFSPDINLKNFPTASFGADTQTPSPKKQVEFTSSTKSRYEFTQPSPSPSKILAPHDVTSTDVVYPTLPSFTPDSAKTDTPTIRRVRDSASAAQPASPLANFPSISHGISSKKRQHDNVNGSPKPSETVSKPPVTFSGPTNDSQNMLTVPHGIKNKKRHREEDGDSDAPSKEVSRPDVSSSAKKSPSTALLAVPHGINHKKRQRVDDDVETENIPPATTPTDEQRSVKRLKASPIKMNPVSPSPLKSRGATPRRLAGSRAGTPNTASKKGILSLSRLNMLAKPKPRA